jgi:hypothetical protein
VTPQEELPLLELFTRLKESDIPLGLDEYQLALKAIQAGFGVKDLETLSRMCKALWVSSQADGEIFDYHFAEIFRAKPKSRHGIAADHLKEQIKLIQEITQKTSRYAKLAAIVSAVCFTGFFAVGWHVGFFSEDKPLEKDSPQIFPPGEDPAPVAPPLETEATPEPVVDAIYVLALLVAGASFLGIKFLLDRKNQTLPETDIEAPKLTTTDDQPFQPLRDEVQLAESIRHSEERKHPSASITFARAGDYFPITQRQMKQSWRYLRRNLREGPATELDVEATIDHIGRQGILLNPVMLSPRKNRTELVLLSDQDGSMVPFQGLSRRLAETAQRSGRLDNAGIYYFHNCPVEFIYQDTYLTEGETIDAFLQNRLSQRSVVLIFSDGGAARRAFNPMRTALTKAFLTRLQEKARYIVWLNPMPQGRWSGTTAASIAKWVPMFEVSRSGFQSAIDVLRGRHKPALEIYR